MAKKISSHGPNEINAKESFEFFLISCLNSNCYELNNIVHNCGSTKYYVRHNSVGLSVWDSG